MPPSAKTRLTTETLGVRVPGRTLIEDLDLELEPGELLAVLGQNGTGKTLCLMTLAGLRAPDAGRVLCDGRPAESMQRKQFARCVALLPQDTEDVFPATVRETVLIGRYPHIGRFDWESAEDVDIANEALARVGLAALAERDVLSLSGGERRRLAVAQIVAQRPDVYLLDEPTNHLDPQHQLETMRLFRRLADEGAAVAASLHDVNLAARFADRCLLLFGDGRFTLGARDEVLDERLLSELYATPMHALDWKDGRVFVAT